MASEMILPMRTGYMLEYVPKGARRVRKELVSDVVPVMVRVDEDMEIAIPGGGHHLLTVSDGKLYGYLAIEDMTVEGFQAVNRGNRDGMARKSSLFRRNDLLRRGAPPISVLDAPLRETIEIRELVSDGATEGAAVAQRKADELVVSNGLVYRRSTNVPSLEISVLGKRIFAGTRHMSQDHTGNWRSFRIDDVSGAEDFIRRHAERIGKSVEIDRRVLDRPPQHKWTAKGLEAECTDAWWVIRSADTIARDPVSSRSTETMDLDIEVLEHLIAIRRILDPYRRDEITYGKIPHNSTLPDVSTARTMASDVLGRLTAIREVLGEDLRDQSTTLARKVDFIVSEAMEHAPGLTPDNDDMDAIATFSS